MRSVCRCGKGRETDSPQEVPERNTAQGHLDFTSEITSDVSTKNCKNKSVLF